MRLASRLVPLLILAGCSRSPDAPTRARRAPTPAVPESRSLAGRAVETSEHGVWTVRRAATATSGPGGVPGSDDAREVFHRLSDTGLSDTGGSGTGTAAPMPTPMAPPPGTMLADGAAAPAESAAVPPPPTTPATPTTPPPPTSEPGLAPGSRSAPAAAPVDRARAAVGHDRQAGPLRAGSTDDNEAFDAFLAFLAAWSDREDTASKHDALDVSDRRWLRVVDAEGRPWPGAQVRVADETLDRIAWTATTYGDGRAPFYPRVADRDVKGAAMGKPPAGGWVVDVDAQGQHASTRWDGQGQECVVRMGARRPDGPVKLDVAILLDTTGSMGDEIERVRSTLLAVVDQVRALAKDVDLRFGAVLYRDVGDDYVTMRHPFTTDLKAFSDALQSVGAAGGGDGPESLNQGLAETVGRLAWRDGAAKVVFLIADAPPHMDYEGDVPYGTSLVAAVGAGIRVHAVAASGLDPFGTLVFRQTAQLSRGKFVFIEYGSAAQSAASHGVTGPVASNNLDAILVDRLRAEVDGWGKDPAAAPPAGR